jgi:hypothetical protein
MAHFIAGKFGHSLGVFVFLSYAHARVRHNHVRLLYRCGRDIGHLDGATMLSRQGLGRDQDFGINLAPHWCAWSPSLVASKTIFETAARYGQCSALQSQGCQKFNSILVFPTIINARMQLKTKSISKSHCSYPGTTTISRVHSALVRIVVGRWRLANHAGVART